MEMPRHEMEMVDAAAARDVRSLDPWGEPDDESDDDSWDDWQIEDVSVESTEGGSGEPTVRIAAAAIMTAAALERSGATAGPASSAEPDATAANGNISGEKQLARVSPDAFKQGMTVTHPEYGPGKIVALSGAGKNRRATIQFATVGQKKIILAHSAVRPAR
jgi:DNA helicase-2/ATP-dependent DNA helicase PcrA